MNRHTATIMRGLIGSLLLCAAIHAAPSGINSKHGDVVRGGRLWDSWWSEKIVHPPAGTHRLANPDTPQGAESFRCVTCHGWETTSIPTGSDAARFDVLSLATGPTGHGYSAMGLTDRDLIDLLAFLDRGGIETSRYITPEGRFTGNADAGKQHFQGGTGGAMQCIVCHGPDATWLNFGTPQSPRWIGTVADEDPMQLLHKIRFGQPGSVMPGWLAFGGTNRAAADIGAYAQTELPANRRDTQHAARTYAVIPAEPASSSAAPALQLSLAEQIGDLPAEGEHPLIAHVLPCDLNQDGLMDLLACDVDRHQVSWLKQELDGTFSESRVGDAINAPVHAEVTDIDGDGDLDVIVAAMGVMLPSNDEIGSVIILENENGLFTNRTLLDGVRRVTDVRPGDIDGDGDIDLAVSQFGYVEGEIRWMENLGDWQFQSHHLMDRSGAIHGPLVDLDSDGDLDIVVLFSQEWETVQGFINDGKGEFTPLVLHDVPDADFSSSGIDVGDIDGDGDMDIAWANGDAFVSVGYRPLPTHGVQWLENAGDYQFIFHRLGQFDGAYAPTIADLDGDGDMDIAAVSEFANWDTPGTPSVRWWAQDADGQFAAADLDTDPTHLVTLAAADMNADGRTDLIGGGMALYPPFDRVGRVSLWRNEGVGEQRTNTIGVDRPAIVNAALARAEWPGAMGMVLQANNEPSLADAEYAKAESLDASEARWPYYRGLLDLAVGDSDAALMHFERAKTLNNTYSPLHSRLGELYAGQGNLYAAEAAWLAAGERPEALTGLATLAAARRDWQQVVVLLQGKNILAAAPLLAHATQVLHGVSPGPLEAVDMGLQPDDPWRDAMLEQCVLAGPIVVRAQIAFIRGDANESERLLRRAVLVAPSDEDAKLALANMLMLSKRATLASVQEAFTLLDQANDDSARDPSIRSRRAWALSLLGQKEEAGREWEAIVALHPEHAPSLLQLGQLHAQAGRSAQALEYFRSGIAVPRDTAFSGSFEGPLRAVWMSQYGTTAKKEGQIDEAIAAFAEAVRLTPKDATARFQYGNILLGRKRFAEALPHLEAAATDSKIARRMVALGVTLINLGRVDSARMWLLRAVEVEPAFALGWYHLGMAEQEMGNRNAAKTAFRTAVELQPQFLRAKQALERVGE
ncbi:MAG: FG-GAP-like repeat-containing protein [Phycisphaerales bacterium]|nr:FG-GAP-like repeat-containing protein [Phycisphaerales bacterium]